MFMVAQMRFVFSNVLKILASCIRYVLGVIEAPYRKWFYKHHDTRTILINLTMKNHFELFKRIYNQLSKDKRLRICFTDSFFGGKKWLDFLLEEGVDPSQILSHWQVLPRRWDVCIDADYYSPLVLRAVKWIKIEHGVAGRKRGPGGKDYMVSRRMRKYDNLFCSSQRQCEILRTSGFLKEKNSVMLIGFPKLDSLVDGSISRDEVLRDYGADPGKLSVLYAPSWPDFLSLEQIGVELIDALCDGPWTFMVKLHPRSYYVKSRSIGKDMGHKQNWQEFLDKRTGEGRLIHVTDQDTCRYVTATDILVSDHGSMPFEYMVLGRPVLYYDTEQAASFMSVPERLDMIRKAVFSFNTAEKAVELTEKRYNGELQEGDERSAAKKECVESFFHDVGGASDRAVKAIYELLGIPKA